MSKENQFSGVFSAPARESLTKPILKNVEIFDYYHVRVLPELCGIRLRFSYFMSCNAVQSVVMPCG